VRDKLERLGWPLVVNYFVVSPLMSGWLGVVLGDGSMLSYMRFETTVTWFLATLLTLSIAYAIIPVPEASLLMPSAAGIICACTSCTATSSSSRIADADGRADLTGFNAQFVSANVSPSKNSGYQDNIDKLEKIKEQLNGLDQEENKFWSILTRVQSLDVQECDTRAPKRRRSGWFSCQSRASK